MKKYVQVKRVHLTFVTFFFFHEWKGKFLTKITKHCCLDNRGIIIRKKKKYFPFQFAEKNLFGEKVITTIVLNKIFIIQGHLHTKIDHFRF